MDARSATACDDTRSTYTSIHTNTYLHVHPQSLSHTPAPTNIRTLASSRTPPYPHARSSARHPNDRHPTVTTNGVTPSLVHADAEAISAGRYHSMVMKQDGTVWATGENKYGELGDGTKTRSKIFKKVSSGQCGITGIFTGLCCASVTMGILAGVGVDVRVRVRVGEFSFCEYVLVCVSVGFRVKVSVLCFGCALTRNRVS